MSGVVHCKKESFDIYIGRPSPWGNPWSHRDSKFSTFKTKTVEEAIENFEAWLRGERFINVLSERRNFIINHLYQLKGKTLGCWCPSDKCHGNILIKLTEEYE